MVGLAKDTAAHTDEVAASSVQLTEVVSDIHLQLGAQSDVVVHIVSEISHTRRQLEQLKHSVTGINTIIGTVMLSPTRLISWPSMLPLRLQEQVKRVEVLPWWPKR